MTSAGNLVCEGRPSSRATEFESAEGIVRACLAEVLSREPDTLTHDLSMENEPAWDSFAHVEIASLIATRCGVEIPPATLIEISSMGDFIAALAELDTGG